MKTQLKALWTAATKWLWRTAWKQWLLHAEESRILALRLTAKRLSGYWRGIRAGLYIGQLEGLSHRIKVVKRTAYGYRDGDVFFMKIKAAFPGNP